MRKVLWLDLETTGINPKFNGIIQLAGIITFDGLVVEEFNFKMNPPETTEIDDYALQVCGMTREEIAGFPSSLSQYQNFKAILDKHVNKFDKKDKFVLAGYNINFDSQFLLRWFQRHNDKYLYSYLHGAKLDVTSFVVAYCIKNGILPENFKLGTIAGMLGFSANFHDAMDDIRTTKQIYEYVS